MLMVPSNGKPKRLDLDLLVVEIFTIREMEWRRQYPTQYLDKSSISAIIKDVLRKGGNFRLKTGARHITQAFAKAEKHRWGDISQWMP